MIETTDIFTDVPAWLGDALGISATNAAFLLSAAILTSMALVLAIVGRKNLNIITIAVPMIAVMGFLVAVAWLPYWVLLVLGLLVATQLALKFREVVT